MNLREFSAVADLLAQRCKTPEGYLKDQVVKALLLLPGISVIRQNVGVTKHGNRWVRYGQPGIADLMIRQRKNKCQPWATVWIELKSKDGKLSEAQQAFAEQCQQWGDQHYVCRTVEDVLTALGVQCKDKSG